MKQLFKELKEELKFIMEYPILRLFIIGTFTGIIPCCLLGMLGI